MSTIRDLIMDEMNRPRRSAGNLVVRGDTLTSGMSFVQDCHLDAVEAAIRADEDAKSAAEIKRLRVRGDNALNVLNARYRAYEELEQEHVALKARAAALRDAALQDVEILRRDGLYVAAGRLQEDIDAYDGDDAPTPGPETAPMPTIYHLGQTGVLFDMLQPYAIGVDEEGPLYRIWSRDLERIYADLRASIEAELAAPTPEPDVVRFATLKRLDKHMQRLNDHELELHKLRRELKAQLGDHGEQLAAVRETAVAALDLRNDLTQRVQALEATVGVEAMPDINVLHALLSGVEGRVNALTERIVELEAEPVPRPVVTDEMIEAGRGWWSETFGENVSTRHAYGFLEAALAALAARGEGRS